MAIAKGCGKRNKAGDDLAGDGKAGDGKAGDGKAGDGKAFVDDGDSSGDELGTQARWG